jgi:type IV secretion system protein VirB10
MKRRASGPDPRTLLGSAELEAANRQAIPKVAGAGASLGGGALGLAAAIGLGLFTFTQMNAARLREKSETIEPPPAQTIVVPETPPAPIPARPEPVVFTPPPAPVDDEPVVRPERLRAPALVVDIGPSAEERAAAASAAAGEGLTASEKFALRASGAENAPATALAPPDLSTTVLEGGIIAGVLETALNSDLPGFVRAVVSEDVRSFDGRKVLVPRASRLVGQYRSGLAIGESRAFVIWTRLILPDGVSIALASPATDTLGRSGLSGKVDRHFLQRFGSAILLSVIGAGLDAAVGDTDGQIVISSTTEAFSIAQTALAANVNIPPTIRVPQGAPIRIFVARDLRFPQYAADAGAGAQR